MGANRSECSRPSTMIAATCPPATPTSRSASATSASRRRPRPRRHRSHRLHAHRRPGHATRPPRVRPPGPLPRLPRPRTAHARHGPRRPTWPRPSPPRGPIRHPDGSRQGAAASHSQSASCNDLPPAGGKGWEPEPTHRARENARPNGDRAFPVILLEPVLLLDHRLDLTDLWNTQPTGCSGTYRYCTPIKASLRSLRSRSSASRSCVPRCSRSVSSVVRIPATSAAPA